MEIYFSENSPNIDVKIDYSVEANLRSFKEEVLDTLYNHHKNHKIERILLSDGMDSRFIALCLKELGISFSPLTYAFSNEQTKITKRVEEFCKKIGVKASFFLFESKLFFDHIDYLTYDKKVAYPFINGYYMDFICHNYEENFYCGASCEFKYYDNEYLDVVMVTPNLVKKNNPDRLFGFANSRTLLSYINHSKFLSNFNSPLTPESSYSLHIRDLIYTDIFPELDVVKKEGYWYDGNFKERFDNYKLDEIKKEVPWVFQLKNYRFNVQEYFKTLKNNPSVVQPG